MINFADVGFFPSLFFFFLSSDKRAPYQKNVTKDIWGVLHAAPRTFLYVYLIGFYNITHANVHIESVTISSHNMYFHFGRNPLRL